MKRLSNSQVMIKASPVVKAKVGFKVKNYHSIDKVRMRCELGEKLPQSKANATSSPSFSMYVSGFNMSTHNHARYFKR